jgi:hypothetical protein
MSVPRAGVSRSLPCRRAAAGRRGDAPLQVPQPLRSCAAISAPRRTGRPGA